MSIFTTPLQIGYFMGLLFAVIFWYRSYTEERHSDLFLGFVVFFLAMSLQDYTFGFAGINYLWEELNGFPRYFSLISQENTLSRSLLNREILPKFTTLHRP